MIRNATNYPVTFSHVLCFCLILITGLPSKGQTLTAEQIFNRMRQMYTTAQTYQDKGSVTVDFYESGTGTRKFLNQNIRNSSTAYDRQTGRFRFEYKTKKQSFNLTDHYIIWSDGKQTKSWWTVTDSVRSGASLDEELSVATGVSGTLSRKIPGLLLPDKIGAGSGIESMDQFTYLGTGTLAKQLCYRISGRFRKDQRIVLWIDQKTFLLLGIDEGWVKLTARGNTYTESDTRIRYEPTVNQLISSGAFIFDPPSAPRFMSRNQEMWSWPILKNILLLGLFLLIVYAYAWRRFGKGRNQS